MGPKNNAADALLAHLAHGLELLGKKKQKCENTITWDDLDPDFAEQVWNDSATTGQGPLHCHHEWSDPSTGECVYWTSFDDLDTASAIDDVFLLPHRYKTK